ncbi:MAG: class I SAM-dependent methyltransferase [Sphingobacteriia bacterium]
MNQNSKSIQNHDLHNSVHDRCILCKTTAPQEMPEYAGDGLVRCQKCGFVFCQRIPTEAELIAHYGTYSRSEWISPITLSRYNELLKKFETYRKNNRILDVGAGNGHFLYTAKQSGWEVYGTEFTDEAIRLCRQKGIQMHQGKLDPKNYAGEFDVVTSFEVIEHINDPAEELQKFRQVLRTGGLVYITTPNFNALARNMAKSDWAIIEYPEHLCYYTPQTLKQAFTQEGFEAYRIQTTGIDLSRRKSLKKTQNTNTTETLTQANRDSGLRSKVERIPLLRLAKKLINLILTTLGKGDTIKAYFIKR